MEIRAAKRVSHTSMQTIAAPPEAVFPLYCPVREADWVRGWDPELVVAESGAAEVDCVFTTRQGGRESTWLITEHDAEAGRVAMVRITPGVVVARITIDLAPLSGVRTAAAITYTYTSLGPEGDAVVKGFTRAAYDGFMTEWELEMNHYLRTGEKLCAED